VIGSGEPWLGPLFARTYAIYRAHLKLLLVVAAGVASVVELILGLGLGRLSAGYSTSSPVGAQLVDFAGSVLVTTPLITAMLARAVLDVLDGEQPTARRAIRCGLDLFAPLLIVTVLFVLGVFAGLVAFVIPGAYLSVSWYFVAQAVVVDGRRGIGALARSGELVRGRWLAVAMTGVAFQVVVVTVAVVLSGIFAAAARSADVGAIVMLSDILVQTVTVPFIAIGSTLVYLDLRAGPVRA